MIKKPDSFTELQQNLIKQYSCCKLGMTPNAFYAKWPVTHSTIAMICSRSVATVGRWFSRGSNYLRPQPSDLRHLALMDFLLEHFEEIPEELQNLLCPPNQDQ
ncbi:MAG: helix-turn-helix domain-containing protein [Moorea sp. SIO3G5]|nr:helix-turn-helix domain-containing protein [Moorena sp. SIO3G5]